MARAGAGLIQVDERHFPQTPGHTTAQAARVYAVSPKIVSRWVKRLKQDGRAAMDDGSEAAIIASIEKEVETARLRIRTIELATGRF